MKIMKFGGSSVGSPEIIRNVIKLIKEESERSPHLAVVVSAFGGVTDQLIQMSQQAAKGDMHYLKGLSHLEDRHIKAAENLIAEKSFQKVSKQLDNHFRDLSDALKGVLLLRELSKRSLDFIMSFGEILSAYIISEALKSFLPSATFLDARELVKTDHNFGGARVNYDKTYPLIQAAFKKNPSFLHVVTGFIASTDDQETTTLGRGGSDFTASIFGAALGVEEIQIWTDVDGVMTADPRKVQQAFPIPQMSYKEALEMSHFGAKVIHPPTIVPALKRKIPLRILNTFNPAAKGTLISNNAQDHDSMISGISSMDNIALLRFEGSGIVGTPGMSMRLFGALAKREINVILISQSSSEHSICFAILPQYVNQAKEAIEAEFSLERHVGLIEPLIVELDLSVIAVVGENMRKIPGIAGRLFGALGRNGINVVAIMQGSSEYNVTAVIDKHDEAKALNVIHEDFFLSKTSSLNLYLVGTGLIGSTLLEIIKMQTDQLKKEQNLDVRLVGLANSQKMHFDTKGINIAEWHDLLHSSEEKMEVSAFITKMKEKNLINSIFVDCTANQEVANHYKKVLEASISIVTPNKKANSGRYQDYKLLKELSKRKGLKFYYETNVGGGLPIISTINNLIRSGDKIIKIEAILSGTLSYLFNIFKEGKSFSDALHEAQEKGFTEPDPREDLNGKDVARKLLILARESGYSLEMEDIHLELLLPQECFDAPSVKEFYHNLEKYNSVFEERRMKAQKEGKVLRYVSSLENGKAKISLQALDMKHPFAHLSASDNIIALTTERYRVTPLVIKGQGAGAEVTAGEVFADILRIAAQ